MEPIFRIAKQLYTFIWKIENYSYSWQNVDECICSPSFQIFSADESCWRLWLYPRGKGKFKNSIGLYLERTKTAQGQEYVIVDYDLSILNTEGTAEYKVGEKECSFAKGSLYGFSNLVTRGEILQTKKSTLLPDDTLTVQCFIQLEHMGMTKHIRGLGKSFIYLHRQLFLWDAGDFNSITISEDGYFSKFSVENAQVGLRLNEDSVYVHLAAADDVNRMFRLRIGILDSNRSVSQFLIDEYVFNQEKSTIASFLIAKSELLQKKDLYLPQGRLVLHCELIFSRRIRSGNFECIAYDEIFTV